MGGVHLRVEVCIASSTSPPHVGKQLTALFQIQPLFNFLVYWSVAVVGPAAHVIGFGLQEQKSMVGSLTWNMNFTSRKYLYPHSFTLPMVRCTVQKVGQKYVDFHGNGMCLYLHPNTMVNRKLSEDWSTIPSKTILGGRALKLHFQLR